MAGLRKGAAGLQRQRALLQAARFAPGYAQEENAHTDPETHSLEQDLSEEFWSPSKIL